MGHHTLFSRFRSNCSRGVVSYLFGSGGFCLKKYANIVIIIPQSGSCTWVQVIYWAVCGKVGWVGVVQAGIIQNSSIVIFIHDIYYVVFNRHATLKLCVLQKAVFEWQRAWHCGFFPYLWCSMWSSGKKFWLAENLCSGMLKAWMPEGNSLRPLFKKYIHTWTQNPHSFTLSIELSPEVNSKFNLWESPAYCHSTMCFYDNGSNKKLWQDLVKSGRIGHRPNTLSSRQAFPRVAFLQYDGVRGEKSFWILANRLGCRKCGGRLWSIPAREVRGGLVLNPTCFRARLWESASDFFDKMKALAFTVKPLIPKTALNVGFWFWPGL